MFPFCLFLTPLISITMVYFPDKCFRRKKISIKRLPSIKYMKVVFTNYIYELFYRINHNRFSVNLSFNLVWHTLIDSGNVIIFLDDFFVILFTYESSAMGYTLTFKTRICGIDKGNHNVPCSRSRCTPLMIVGYLFKK